MAFIEIFLDKQILLLHADREQDCKTYSISSSKFGAGQLKNSYCTPTGRHIIRAKIGHDVPKGSVFVGRRLTGEIYSAALAKQHPERDWILTRILWLSGLDLGLNRLGTTDSMQRYIYIHGTPESEPIGIPCSIGCIRMRNDDISELFEQTPVYTHVHIYENTDAKDHP